MPARNVIRIAFVASLAGTFVAAAPLIETAVAAKSSVPTFIIAEPADVVGPGMASVTTSPNGLTPAVQDVGDGN